MPPRSFSLTPFPAPGRPPGLAIAGSIARCAGALSVECEIRGDLSALDVPGAAGTAVRRDRLWEGTCLELFLAAGGSGRYWEFNLSPAGHWNVYRFDSYREGMREDPAFSSLPFAVRTDAATLRLSLSVDIGRIVPADAAVDVAVCAVVRTRAGGTSHWALAHTDARPDFHRRDGFRLTIPASS